MAFVSAARAQTPIRALPSQISSVRLVADPTLTNGHYKAGVEIIMVPGSHTYWKNPGEAGVPPVFSFNSSTNIAKADVKFPVPSRMSEEGLDAFGYTDEVLFPVEVTPKDPQKPSELRVNVSYAVCNKICIPAQASATLALPPSATDSATAAIRQALAQVPQALPEGDATDLDVVSDARSETPAWTVRWKGAQPIEDIFPDAPEGFYFSTKKSGPQQWTLSADRSVTAKGLDDVRIALVLARKGGGFIATKVLDLAGAKK